MSKQANKTVIGAFVIGAIALVVAGVLIFGSGRFLKERDSYVLYFEGSVKGLNIGSPVLFRGVKVGSVTDIRLRFDPEDLTVYIPVVIEVEPDRFSKGSNDKHPKQNVDLLVEKGLRAQLELQSMVTGQLMVNFDFQPDEPVNLTGIKSEYIELPTIPSDMEKLSRTIENIPFDELINKLTSAVGGLERVLNSPELIGSIQAAEKALEEINKLKFERVGQEIRVNLVALEHKSGDVEKFKKLIEKINNDIISFLIKGKLPIQDAANIQEARIPRGLDRTRMKEERTDLLSQAHSDTQGPRKTQPVVREKRKIGRNDKVKVKYADGYIMIKKYKMIENDLNRGNCQIVG